MNWKNVDKQQLITVLICIVGTFVLSVIRVQTAATTSALGAVNAYASLQDAGIFASIMALGTPWGVIAPVVGIVLGDIVMGSKNFIIGNLLIRSLMALFVAAFAAKVDDWKKSFVVAGMTEAKIPASCSEAYALTAPSAEVVAAVCTRMVESMNVPTMQIRTVINCCLSTFFQFMDDPPA